MQSYPCRRRGFILASWIVLGLALAAAPVARAQRVVLFEAHDPIGSAQLQTPPASAQQQQPPAAQQQQPPAQQRPQQPTLQQPTIAPGQRLPTPVVGNTVEDIRFQFNRRYTNAMLQTRLFT